MKWIPINALGMSLAVCRRPDKRPVYVWCSGGLWYGARGEEEPDVRTETETLGSERDAARRLALRLFG